MSTRPSHQVLPVAGPIILISMCYIYIYIGVGFIYEFNVMYRLYRCIYTLLHAYLIRNYYIIYTSTCLPPQNYLLENKNMRESVSATPCRKLLPSCREGSCSTGVSQKLEVQGLKSVIKNAIPKKSVVTFGP